MENNAFRVKFWGVRGSIPVSNPEFIRYGGNTSCIEMQCGEHRLLFDAGSGLRAFGEEVRHHISGPLDLFFTHWHYDHVIGFPFFAPLYDHKVKLSIWSGGLVQDCTTRDMISCLMSPPWFPARLEVCRARFGWHDFKAGDVLHPKPGIAIKTAPLNHPGGCVGYRVEWGGRAVAYVSDTEHVDGELDKSALFLMKEADLAIYDCTYLENEMPRRRGFGHSTWEQGVKLCAAAGTKRLAMFHHDPVRSDIELEAMESDAAKAFPGAFAARDGLELSFDAIAAVKPLAHARPQAIVAPKARKRQLG